MKIILRIVKIILLIVGLETGYAERSRIFVQASAIFVQASAKSNLFGLCRAQPKMSRNRACSYCRAQPKISKKRSRKVRVYEPMSGQDKPVISDGFEVQTIHAQPVWIQTVMRISAGLKGFTGKLMRNARARKHISAFSKARQTLIYMHLFLIFSLRFSAAKNRALRGQIKWTIAEHTAYSQTIQRRNVWNPNCGCKVHCVPLQEQLWGIP